MAQTDHPGRPLLAQGDSGQSLDCSTQGLFSLTKPHSIRGRRRLVIVYKGRSIYAVASRISKLDHGPQRSAAWSANENQEDLEEPPMDGFTMDGVTDQLVVEKKDGVGYVRFDNQAKKNAMTFEMWRDLPTVLDDFLADDAVRVVVVSGEGGGAFCAGADISQFEKNRSSEDGVKIYNAATEKASERLREFPK
ncbi:MAG TPA: hypothetical protein DEB21_00565, partial [Rhodospirillaceae bacterium]|nr:hypothetical protein [Rhodospirillaceae bacterium]